MSFIAENPLLAGPLFSREALIAPRHFKHFLIRAGYVASLFLLMYTAGLRRGEVARLRMEDVDMALAHAFEDCFGPVARIDTLPERSLAHLSINQQSHRAKIQIAIQPQ